DAMHRLWAHPGSAALGHTTRCQWAMHTLLWWLAALWLGWGAGASSALAHAELDSASPAAGAVLVVGPEQVELVFSEPLAPEPEFSFVRVLDVGGASVHLGNSRVDPTNPY